MKIFSKPGNLFPSKEKIFAERFLFWTLMTFLFVLPFGFKALSLLIAMMLAISIYHLITNVNKISFSVTLIGFVLFYLFHLAGVFYSNNRDEAWFDLEVKMSFFIFPFILMIEWQILKKYFTRILLVFIFSVLLVMLTDIIIATLRYIDDKDTSTFYYEKLSLFMHPSYFGMYINFSIFIIFTFVQNDILRRKWIWGIAILISLLFQYFLSSRTNIIISILLGMIMIIIDRKYFPSRYLQLLFVGIFVLLVFFNRNERFRQLNTHTLFVKDMNMDILSSVSTRVLLWDSALDIIKQNFWTGVGTGDLKAQLSAQNLKNGYKKVGNISFNAHNEYLEVFIKLGIFGFLWFVILLFTPFYVALKNKDILLFGFLLIVCINFLTESMLNRQAGILFFMFFYSILIMRNTTKIDIHSKI
jgi:O-antigen ligase